MVTGNQDWKPTGQVTVLILSSGTLVRALVWRVVEGRDTGTPMRQTRVGQMKFRKVLESFYACAGNWWPFQESRIWSMA